MLYNVNSLQIDVRLQYLSTVNQTLRLLRMNQAEESLIDRFALERAIHVAAECITDVGNYMIDGFVMRDAASYEDIVDILFGEHVFSISLYELLTSLVKLRKPLVQSYYDMDAEQLKIQLKVLPEALDEFIIAIKLYITSELGDSIS